MTIDRGLDLAVQSFVEAIADALSAATKSLPESDPQQLRDAAMTEAFNLTKAFIDADQKASDDELWALIGTFGAAVGPELADAQPKDLRDQQLTDGALAWTASTSDLFEILIGVDRRENSDLAMRYYLNAMALAHSVAALDAHTSRDELLALDTFRGLLLNAIKTVTHLDTARDQSGDTSSATATAATPAVKGDPPIRSLEELLGELDALIGLDEVKREIRLVADLLQVQQLRRERSLPVSESSRHLVFTGNPGTGKTTVARLLAQIYRTMGVVSRGQLIESDRTTLVAGFVGQTAPLVAAAFDAADEGVLLIDEAYSLARGTDSDFGREAIDAIVKLVEDRRDRLVVIVAGYPDEMAMFFAANPGLPSRFPRTITFPDYSTEELVEIFQTACAEGGYQCDAGAITSLHQAFASEPRLKGFGNGRVARNWFERAIERQASRVVTIVEPTDRELTTLTADDVSQASSRVAT
ncbi:MAG: AAA family ATPase [Actinomycetes bacterium]